MVMTMFFLIIIMGATDQRAPAGLAPIAIGLALTLIHLISIPVPHTSSTPPAATVWLCLWVTRPWRSCGCSGWPRSQVQCWVLSLTD